MPLLNQHLDNFLNGVSQEPAHMRDLSRVSVQTNGFSSLVAGLGKRPGTAHVAKIIADTADTYDGAATFVLSEGLDERYIVIALNGDLKVFDLETGTAKTVSFPDGKTYLNKTSGPSITKTDDFTGTNGAILNGRTIGPFAWARKYVSTGTTDPWTIQSNSLKEATTPLVNTTYVDGFTPPVDNYSVSFRLGLVSFDPNQGAAAFVVKMRAQSDGKCYNLNIVWASNGTKANLTLTTNTSATWSATGGDQIATISGVPWDWSSPQTVRVEVHEASFTVYLNDISVLTGTDITNALPNAGLQGFYSGGALFDSRALTIDDWTISYTPLPTVTPADYELITVGGTSYFLNKTIEMKQGSTKSDIRGPEALIVITQADYGTQYDVTLNGISVAHTTPLGVDASRREDISTDFIAGQIKSEIEALDALNGFTIDRYGSTLHVYRSDNADFTISATDGLADNGLNVVKGSIQHFSDLPLRAPSGFVVKVTGDPTTAVDDFWVKFDDSHTSGVVGVWKECPKPGTILGFDASTMPHRLFKEGDLYEGLVNVGLDSLPVVSPYGSAETAELIGKEVDGDTQDAEDDLTEGWNTTADLEENDCIFSSLSALNGGACTVRVNYDVGSIITDAASPMTAMVWKSDLTTGSYASRTWTVVATKEYPTAGVFHNEQLEFTMSDAANTDIRIALIYDGSSKIDAFRTSYIKVHAKNDALPGVTVTRNLGQKIKWDSSATYPSGMKFTVAVGATDTFAYTLPADKTGAQVATALKALIDADADWVAANDVAGEIEITPASGSASFTVTVTNDFDSDTTFFDPDASFTASDLVGKTINNLTDGSTGTITANSATSITVTALSGGATNTFNPGDECSIPSAGSGFTFAQVNWKERGAGDVFSNPNPSFVNDTATGLFHYRGRLGILTGSTVALSAAGEPTRFFRQSVAQLLDNDPIDVQDSSKTRRRFHAAIEWNDNLILWTDETQAVLTGDQLLTPKSVRLIPLTSYKNNPLCPPLAVGDSILYARDRKVFALRVSPDTQQAVQLDLTLHCPTYIADAPTAFAADEPLGISIARAGLDSTLYVLAYVDERARKQLSWGKWTFAGEGILGHIVYDGTLYLVNKYADGLYLETLDLRAGNGA